MRLGRRLRLILPRLRLQQLLWRDRAHVLTSVVRSHSESLGALARELIASVRAWTAARLRSEAARLRNEMPASWRTRAAIAMGCVGLAAMAEATGPSLPPSLSDARGTQATQIQAAKPQTQGGTADVQAGTQPQRQSAPTVPMQAPGVAQPVPLVPPEPSIQDSQKWANSAPPPAAAPAPELQPYPPSRFGWWMDDDRDWSARRERRDEYDGRDWREGRDRREERDKKEWWARRDDRGWDRPDDRDRGDDRGRDKRDDRDRRDDRGWAKVDDGWKEWRKGKRKERGKRD